MFPGGWAHCHMEGITQREFAARRVETNALRGSDPVAKRIWKAASGEFQPYKLFAATEKLISEWTVPWDKLRKIAGPARMAKVDTKLAQLA